MRKLLLLFILLCLSSSSFPQKGNRVELNFSNLEILNLVDLMSKLTGKTFLYDERDLSGKKATLVSPGNYTKREAFAIFEAILDVNGLTTIKYDSFVRIINKNNAKREPAPIVGGNDGEDSFVTRVVKLKNINVNSARATVSPLVSPTTTMVQYPQGNLLIIKDTSTNSDHIIRLIEQIDKAGPPIRVERLTVKSADLNQANQFITRIINQKYSQNKAGQPILVPDQVSSSIIVAGSSKDILEIKKILEQIDVGHEAIKLQIFQVSHSKVEDLTRILNSVFKSGKKSAAINIIPDTSFNRLIVTAKRDTLKKIKSLISELDRKIPQNRSEYRVFRLNNANAKEISPVLQQATRSISLIAQSNSSTGANGNNAKKAAAPAVSSGKPLDNSISIIADEATNSLVVYASSEEFPVIEKVIRDLDIVRPQVFVEALIMEVSLEKSLDVGVDWKASSPIEQNGVTEGVSTISSGGRSANPSTFAASAAAAPSGTTIGILGRGIPFGDEIFSSFSAFIQATQTDSDINILSNPKVLTLNNKEAEIKVGEVRPFQTALKIDSNGAESRSFEYKEVGITLKLTPQINPDGTIKLNINQSSQEIRQSSESSQQNFTPVTLERSIKSDVVVADSDVIVLGGLINDTIESIETKIPFLGDIPFIGWLFKSKSEVNRKTNLLVFISPTIVRNNEDLFNVTERSKKNQNEASKGNFRLDISEELGMPSVLIPLPEDLEHEERIFVPRKKSLPEYNPRSFFDSYGAHGDNEDSETLPEAPPVEKEEVPTIEFDAGEIPIETQAKPVPIQKAPPKIEPGGKGVKTSLNEPEIFPDFQSVPEKEEQHSLNGIKPAYLSAVALASP